ncbi:hypothetical protein [Spirosoma sp. KNUC1025]|uniref:hypothetical protein n=1 Tax=Spirosoma sp. KNUC1025 TaxID=2894082 RepID=UPI001E533DEC|nr:hypothetical protein [Spirosoma sp. KNUC1025]UFH57738.1 hypothetical protein LN737_32450 [Spirosoma sp. KNUC1025]
MEPNIPLSYQQRANALLDHLLITPALPVDYENWNIQGALPQDSIMLFISQEHMASFKPWSDFLCRTIKLINFDKPAVRITLFLTHRYKIKKADKISTTTQKSAIRAVIDQLLEDQQTLHQQISRPGRSRFQLEQASQQLQHLQSRLQQWHHYAAAPADFEVAISNYERYYLYHTINFKYQTEDKKGRPHYTNETAHLIKTQVDFNQTQAQTRYNVVFLDMDQMVKPAPYQHKTIHAYLANFTDKAPINFGKEMVYIRPKGSAAPLPPEDPQEPGQSRPGQPGGPEPSSPEPASPEPEGPRQLPLFPNA